MAGPAHLPSELLLRSAAYAVLRRGDPRLPALRLSDGDEQEAAERLSGCFAAARSRLTHAPEEAALFAPGQVPVELPLDLARLLEAETERVAEALAADTASDPLGPRFEAASGDATRRSRGQHFTPSPVVELVLGLARAGAAANIMDPTCGTGAFLTRAATLAPRARLWGCELDPLAAALARINLRRHASAAGGHVHTGDLLSVLPGAEVGGARLPPCDAMVGNLPYVRLHRQEVTRWRRELGQRWAARDPELVTGGGRGRPRLRLSGHADLYALLFYHLADLVAPGGRLALLTANAYLDADYGRLLEQLFLRHFHLVAVVESRCEPWFADASVNTVITVLERPTDEARSPRAGSPRPARFVQLTRPLLPGTGEGSPPDPRQLAEAIEQTGSDSAPARTEAGVGAEELPYETLKTPHCRIRLVEPSRLREASAGTGPPWSAYLRAPDVYFRLREHPGLRPAGELVTIRRGVTTNWNPFFYPPAEAATAAQVEEEYLVPVVRSPRVSRAIGVKAAGLSDRLFLCGSSQQELEDRGHRGALGWIARGSRMTNRQGRPISETLAGRPWYRVDPTPYRLLLTKTTHDTHLHRLLDHPTAVDQRLYGVTPADPADTELVAALLNSSVVALMTEVVGSASLGEGALDLPVTAARRLLMPDPAALSAAHGGRILRAFEPLLYRPVEPVWQEVEHADRQALDRAVLTALDLDVDRLLPQLYEGLCGLTRERLTLARRRRALKA